MSLVMHFPNGENSRGYFYNHYRDGDKVKCQYVGDGTYIYHTQQTIKEGDFRKKEGYKERHEYANEQEKKKYGKKRFGELQKIIQEKLNPGELAGKYENGKIIVNENVPEKYREQVAYHEMREMEYEAKVQRHAVLIGAKVREQKIKAALRHENVLGAGAERRRKLKLTREEHVRAVMKEYEMGTLHTSSGKLVTSKEQALAIAYSEIRQKEVK